MPPKTLEQRVQELEVQIGNVRNSLDIQISEHAHDGNEASQVNYNDIFGLPKYYEQVVVFDFGTNVTSGDGAYYIHIPEGFSDYYLAEVHAEHITAGSGGTDTAIQINNTTQSVDMLSTKLQIDSGETGSDTAATAAVIDTTNDDIAENDLLRIDVDAVDTSTAPKGLIVTLGFKK